MAPKPIKTTVVDTAIGQITDMIVSGRFNMGEKLPSEFELMKELQVSRNSLREAMKMLEVMGVVDIRRGDGTYICNEISPSFLDSIVYSILFERASTLEIVELRQALDEMVMSVAINKITAQELEHLIELIDQMKACLDSGDFSKAASLDFDFHMFLTQCTGNAFIYKIVAGVYKLFAPSMERNLTSIELYAMADTHHLEMVRCLKEKDIASVHSVIDNSLSSWKKGIK